MQAQPKPTPLRVPSPQADDGNEFSDKDDDGSGFLPGVVDSGYSVPSLAVDPTDYFMYEPRAPRRINKVRLT